MNSYNEIFKNKALIGYVTASDPSIEATEAAIEEMIKNNEIIGQENIFNPSFNYHNNFVCHTCNYSKCPKNYAGYIYYLITQGLIENVLKGKPNEDIINIYPHDSNQKYNEIEYAIEKLPSNYKIVIFLKYYNQMNSKEIASILNITEATVRKRLDRARRLLKQLIKESEKNG